MRWKALLIGVALGVTPGVVIYATANGRVDPKVHSDQSPAQMRAAFGEDTK